MAYLYHMSLLFIGFFTYELFADPLLTGRWGEELYPAQLIYSYPGKTQSLQNISITTKSRKTSLLVVVSMSSKCPLVRRAVSTLNSIQNAFEGQGVQIVGLFSQNYDDVVHMSEFALHTDANFPVYLDDHSVGSNGSDNSWALGELGFRVTPEVAIFDVREGYQKRQLIYRGLIDDSLNLASNRTKARQNYLRDYVEKALSLPSAGSAEVFESTAAQGCLIVTKKKTMPPRAIAYYPRIARIVESKCVKCHREGELGAEAFMAFNDYDDFTSAIDTVMSRIKSRLMPPWHARIPEEALNHLGGFKNDARLSDEEFQLIEAWYENGMEEGDVADKPLTSVWPDANDWRIGKPDLIFRMPEPFIVPKEKWDGYKYYYIETGFTEDRYIKAIEMRPGNKAIVHHMGGVLGPCPKKKLQGLEAMQHFYGITGDRVMKLGDWIPGDDFNARIYPDNVGLKIPAGYCLALEMHYTPSGKDEKPDISELGIIFHAEKPEIILQTRVDNNKSFMLQPHAGHTKVSDKHWFNTDVEIYALAPHMHYRGKDFTLYHVKNPETEAEVRTKILEVSAYDFRWQRTYEFEKPIQLRAGDHLESIAHLDNSHYNPNNPDPEETVVFGLQSEEEMFNVRIKYTEVVFPQ